MKFLLLWVLLVPCGWAYEMDPATRARLERHLPRTLAKLEKRAPVHLLVVGDGTTRGFHYGETRNQLLHAFPGVFARELAKEFFYTGGVKDLAPEPGAPAKLDESLGPEITIERRAVEDADVFYGFVPLTTDGFDRKPDLVILHFGAGATRGCLQAADFSAALSAQIGLVKEGGSDVILVGPVAAPDGSHALEGVAATRAFAGLMRELAQRRGVYFGDAGRLLVEGLAEPGEIAEGQLEQRFVGSLGRYFDHGPDIQDKRHPNAAAHVRLGELLAAELLGGRRDTGVEASGRARETEGGFQVEVELSNPGDERVSLIAMPMAIGAGTRPVLAEGVSGHEVSLELEAGGRGVLKWVFAEGAGGGWLPWMRCESVAGAGRVLRVPLLLSGEEGFRTLTVDAVLEPLAVVWDFGNQINVKGSWKFGATVFSQTKERWKGRYVVRCGEDEVEGELSIAGGETGRIGAELSLPEGGVTRLKQDVVLELTAEDGVKLVQRHEVELSQNIGTNEWVRLAGKERYLSGSSGGDNPGEGAVMMRAAADRDALFVEFDLRGLELLPSSQGASVIVDLSIDGRYYTDRGSIGFVGPLVVNSGAEDGDAEIHLMELGVFGNGYDRKLAAKNVTGKLVTQGDGRRRLSIVVPKAYFYLHEWALGNGNSQLGINANVSLMRVSDEYPSGYYPLSAQFCLVNPGMSRRDARSLTTLELLEEPTKRWSVRLY